MVHAVAAARAGTCTYGAGAVGAKLHGSRRSEGITCSFGFGAGSVHSVRSSRGRVMLYSCSQRASLAPPSRVSGFHTKLPTDALDFVSMTSNGIDRYTPLSKLPSPNCAAEMLVLVMKAPMLTPLRKVREKSTVTPRSLAR